MAHVVETAAVLNAPSVPRGARGPVRAVVRELRRSCRARPYNGPVTARFARLLFAAVRHLRGMVARDVGRLRRRRDLSRADVARLTGRTERYVGRAERGEAAVSIDFWNRVREYVR